jgi:hypothetical protein
MGVLDDAIREHLELKRRHGASDEEVAREEAEALGPARRDFPAPAAQPEEAAEAGEAQIAEPQSAEPQGEPEAEPQPLAEEPTVIEEPPPAVEPEPVEPEPAEPEPDTRDQASDTPSDEDVLEETPEFLQDAPEHDRLWFEQKPPRDFDFE